MKSNHREKTAGMPHSEAKTGMPPEHFDEAVDAPSKTDRFVAGFPIVGIGASAGGLAAFEAFFSGMPADTEPGMAFVLVQHMAADHKSVLTDLIQSYTRMQVFEAENGMQVQSNSTYIIPPNRDMAFLNGTLLLFEPASPRDQRLPIDFFFRSLAQDQHERSIGVVLSGTGSDGTLGVRAIKGEGGMVMVQSPVTAEFDGMPRSTIATDQVDYQLPPAEMPAQLIAYTTHFFGTPPRPATPSPQTENVIKKIFVLLRAQTGHDFTQYKLTSSQRRINRRMALHQIDSMDGYLTYIRQSPDEMDALLRDMLIGVTRFFRDPEAFKALEEQVIPKLFTSKGADATIRIWVAGCSTGEEAYSLAILLAEQMEALKNIFKVQIFASDIDCQAIAVARAGIYPASIAADLTPDRLARFFTVEPGGGAYSVRKGIREMLVISGQNVIKDPPFSNLDLISCRNLMIYLNEDLHKKLIPMFHYALNPGGYLFLGTSETVSEFGNCFATLEQKIFQRKEAPLGTRCADLSLFLPSLTAINVVPPQTAGKLASLKKLPLRELTEQALLQQVIQAGVLVNAQGYILYLHGRTGMYLEPAPGESGPNNILKMAREGLRHDLIKAMRKAVTTGETVCCPALRVKTNGDFTTVNLMVRQVTVASVYAELPDRPAVTSGRRAALPESSLYLVVLEQAPARSQKTTPANANADAYIAELQRELHATEDYLQTSNEELNSANEEMQLVNDELQSSNEELHTSKEELQTVNEELDAVNAELEAKVADLSRANNDMNNLLAGTGIATVFLDLQLCILGFTPAATKIINLIQSDIGRPVSHIASNLPGYANLKADTQAVLDTLVPKETEVQSVEGWWYTMRILPYRTMDNVIEGAVLTFVNITERKQAEDALHESERFLKSTVDGLSAHIAVLDDRGEIILTNKSYRDIAEANGVDPRAVCEGINYLAVCDAASGDYSEEAKLFAKGIREVLSGKRQFFDLEYPCHSADEKRWFIGRVTPFRDEGPRRVIVAHENVTKRKEAENSLRESEERLQVALNSSFIATGQQGIVQPAASNQEKTNP